MSPINDQKGKEEEDLKNKALEKKTMNKWATLRRIRAMKKKARRKNAAREGLPRMTVSEVEKPQNVSLKFTVNCSRPVEDNLIDVADFEKYLRERIKVQGVTNNFGNSISLESSKTEVSVIANIPFSKLYLKYLTKKFINKCNLRGKLRVVANEKDSYELQYPQNNNPENEEKVQESND